MRLTVEVDQVGVAARAAQIGSDDGLGVGVLAAVSPGGHGLLDRGSSVMEPGYSGLGHVEDVCVLISAHVHSGASIHPGDLGVAQASVDPHAGDVQPGPRLDQHLGLDAVALPDRGEVVEVIALGHHVGGSVGGLDDDRHLAELAAGLSGHSRHLGTG